MSAEIYNALVCLALLGAGWMALFGREAFASTVFFVVYSLLMALAWVQLGAVDVALAEAGIGAGLTGALLVGAIRQFENDLSIRGPKKSLLQGFAAILAGCFLYQFISVLIDLESPKSVISSLVDDNLDVSGTSHPVTAVLLNFRAFDTWLELGVLLLACIGAITIHRIFDPRQIPSHLTPIQDQPAMIAPLMLPALIVIGGVLLWYGSHAPGGAFQAGSLIGAAGILVQIGGSRSFLSFESLGFRLVLVLGFTAFIAYATLTLVIGNQFLEYPRHLAGASILGLEVTATLSIALTLNVMYACSHPWREIG